MKSPLSNVVRLNLVRFFTTSRQICCKLGNTDALRKPQYNFKLFRDRCEDFQESAVRRRLKFAQSVTVTDILESYDRLNAAKRQKDELLHLRNKLQDELSSLTAQKDCDQSKKTDILNQLGELKSQIKEQSSTIFKIEVPVANNVELVPNLISPDSMIDDFQTLEVLNKEGQLPADKARDHVVIALEQGMVDFESASRVSGSSWYYLINDGALLELALIQYALSKARQRGWSPMLPPSIVRRDISNACGFKPRDQNNEQQAYMLDDNLCLTGTAEIPMAGWAAHKDLSFDKGPVKKVGISRSYRAEAGARGRDTKGLYRVHEFTKIELFAWTEGNVDVSSKMLDEILDLQKEIISDLGLCARVLNMPAHDLGSPAYKKYDIEVWMPGRGDWGEVTSASNCLDYQSRRMHTKYFLEDGSTAFTHTLNGTALAVPRVITSILENFYDPQLKKVKIPHVLRKWMDDREYTESI